MALACSAAVPAASSSTVSVPGRGTGGDTPSLRGSAPQSERGLPSPLWQVRTGTEVRIEPECIAVNRQRTNSGDVSGRGRPRPGEGAPRSERGLPSPLLQVRTVTGVRLESECIAVNRQRTNSGDVSGRGRPRSGEVHLGWSADFQVRFCRFKRGWWSALHHFQNRFGNGLMILLQSPGGVTALAQS